MCQKSLSRYGIIGWPVEHSLSPIMQEAAFRTLGMEGAYDLIPIQPDNLKETIPKLQQKYQGWNVTVPHKQTIFPLLDDIDPIAQLGESVNTVIYREGKLSGYSTDGYGLIKALQEAFQLPVSNRSFLFWGTGGAAYASSMYMAGKRAKIIYLINRTKKKAQLLQKKIHLAFPACICYVIDIRDKKAISDTFAKVDVVIQSTILGLQPDDPIAIPQKFLVPPLRIFDMIYHETQLLSEARNQGCSVCDGRGMLLHQGARSFSLWTGKEAPIESMRIALEKAIDKRSK